MRLHRQFLFRPNSAPAELRSAETPMSFELPKAGDSLVLEHVDGSDVIHVKLGRDMPMAAAQRGDRGPAR